MNVATFVGVPSAMASVISLVINKMTENVMSTRPKLYSSWICQQISNPLKNLLLNWTFFLWYVIVILCSALKRHFVRFEYLEKLFTGSVRDSLGAVLRVGGHEFPRLYSPMWQRHLGSWLFAGRRRSSVSDQLALALLHSLRSHALHIRLLLVSYAKTWSNLTITVGQMTAFSGHWWSGSLRAMLLRFSP